MNEKPVALIDAAFRFRHFYEHVRQIIDEHAQSNNSIAFVINVINSKVSKGIFVLCALFLWCLPR